MLGGAQVVDEAALAPAAVPLRIRKDEGGRSLSMGLPQVAEIDGGAPQHGEQAPAERVVAPRPMEFDLDILSREHLGGVDEGHYGWAADILGRGRQAARELGESLGEGPRAPPLVLVPSRAEALRVVGEDEPPRRQTAVAVGSGVEDLECRGAEVGVRVENVHEAAACPRYAYRHGRPTGGCRRNR